MRKLSPYAILTFGMIAFLADAAAAQTTPPNDSAAVPSVDPAPAATRGDGADIIVTGSRIARRDFTSSSPIVTANQEQLRAAGAVTVEASLNQLPQLASSSGAANSSVGRGGVANADLRGLGQQRTLVLIDGRRVQPSLADNSVDLNIIPASIVEGVEVITGGASSTYGSDAIAGVVNFKLRRHFSGLEGTAQYGITDRGDGITKSGSILLGGNFADDRGNAYIAFDYTDRGRVRYPDRPYLTGQSLSQNIPSSLVNANSANLPTQAAINTVFARYGIAAGTVARTAVFSANPDSTLFVGSTGVNFRGPTSDILTTYNNTVYSVAGFYYYAQTPLKRKTIAAHANYDLTPDIEVTLDALYTNYQVTLRANPVTPGTSSGKTITMPITNPFIPADLLTILQSRPNPTASVTLAENLDALGPRTETDEFNVYQITAGLHGRTGISDITWDINSSTGHTAQLQTIANYASSDAYQALIAAADGGRSLCAGGFNPFNGVLSQSCAGYLRRTVHNTSSLRQQVVEATLQGKALHAPAGDVRFALGADYRRNSYSFSPDGLIKAGDIPNFLPVNESAGVVSVKELFAELLVPVIHDTPFIQELNLDLGYRYSDYNVSGRIHTYKADVDWHVGGGLRLRGGYARATRAPNVGELFAATNQGQLALGTAGLFGAGDPCDIKGAYRAASYANAGAVRTLCLAQGVPANIVDTFSNQQSRTPFSSSGNPNLRPESTDTFSVGAVLRSPFATPFLSGLNISVDYYRIKLKDAIGLVTNPVAASQCFDPVANPTFSNTNYFCQLISRDGNGQIIKIVNPLLNLGGYSTDGIDFVVDWTIPLNDTVAAGLGTLKLNAVATYLKSFDIKTLPTSATLDYAGTIGNTQIDQFADAHPRWKATSSVGWLIGPASTTFRWRYIGPMANAANIGTGGTAHGVEGISYFDLDASVKAAGWLTIRGGIANLFDREPPILLDSPVAIRTDIYTYDIVERRYFVGFQARF